MNKEFNLEEFKKLMKMSDLQALEYIEKTIIVDLEYNDKNSYILDLYCAVMALNVCNNDYETIPETNFKQDLYFETRNLLFDILGIEVE